MYDNGNRKVEEGKQIRGRRVPSRACGRLRNKIALFSDPIARWVGCG